MAILPIVFFKKVWYNIIKEKEKAKPKSKGIVIVMKYTVSMRTPMFFPLGTFTSLEKATEKAIKNAICTRIVEIVCTDDNDEVTDIMTFENKKRVG